MSLVLTGISKEKIMREEEEEGGTEIALELLTVRPIADHRVPIFVEINPTLYSSATGSMYRDMWTGRAEGVLVRFENGGGGG